MKVNIQDAGDGDSMLEIPPEIMQILGLKIGDVLDVSLRPGADGLRLNLVPYFCPGEYTVVTDRFHGAYSGGGFIAWPLPSAAIPADSQGGQEVASAFWSQPRLVGKGDTADAALADLKRLLVLEKLHI